MSIFEDEDAVREAYIAVRSDSADVNWVALTYQDKQLTVAGTGVEYDEFLSLCGDDERTYGYVRIMTGDEMSRRSKFAFITWIGSSVSPLKKAKVSTDKAFVKQIFSEFGKELLSDDQKEITYDKVKAILEKASGAAYGTGK